MSELHEYFHNKYGPELQVSSFSRSPCSPGRKCSRTWPDCHGLHKSNVFYMFTQQTILNCFSLNWYRLLVPMQRLISKARSTEFLHYVQKERPAHVLLPNPRTVQTEPNMAQEHNVKQRSENYGYQIIFGTRKIFPSILTHLCLPPVRPKNSHPSAQPASRPHGAQPEI